MKTVIACFDCDCPLIEKRKGYFHCGCGYSVYVKEGRGER